MNRYEILYIIPAQYSEDELAPIKEKVQSVIERFGGKIQFEDTMGKKKLAYPIKNCHQGYYILNHVELEGKNITEVDKQLKLIDEVIRHIIVKNPPKAAAKERRKLTGVDKKKEEAQEKASQKESEESAKIQKEEEKEKSKLADLDKKLDEILDTDNLI